MINFIHVIQTVVFEETHTRTSEYLTCLHKFSSSYDVQQIKIMAECIAVRLHEQFIFKNFK